MKALLLIDLQNDFFEGGALAVPESLEIIAPVNNLIVKFHRVYATIDWHPVAHKSFASVHPSKKPFELIDLNGIKQVLWPDHCVQSSKGAAIHPHIRTPKGMTAVYKGTDPEVDSYSGFFDNGRVHQTELHEILQRDGIKALYVCGLATDYCVKYTVMDALELGYEVFVVSDATKAVNMNALDYMESLAEMQLAGAKLVLSHQV